MKNFIQRIYSISEKMNAKASWRRLRALIAVIVVFTVTYSLVLPAITLDHADAAAMPGIAVADGSGGAGQTGSAEQQLDGKASQMAKVLDCEYAAHKHTDDCYIERDVLDSDGNDTGRKEKVLICDRADRVVHEHDASCYQDGKLACPLPEIKEHRHTKKCYEKQSVLTCALEETDGHKHTDACYQARRKLVCKKKEHKHNGACYSDVVVDKKKILDCPYQEGEVISPAVYSDPVYSDPVIDPKTGEEIEPAKKVKDAEIVKEAVVHHHDSSCNRTKEITKRKLTCEKKEHTHTDKCYKTNKKLICGLEEAPAHHHTKACYMKQKVLACSKLELHTHTMDCYERGPKDESPEKMGWAHYETDENGNQIVVGDPVHRICGEIELLAHQHGDECRTIVDAGEPAENEAVRTVGNEAVQAAGNEAVQAAKNDEVEVLKENDAAVKGEEDAKAPEKKDSAVNGEEDAKTPGKNDSSVNEEEDTKELGGNDSEVSDDEKNLNTLDPKDGEKEDKVTEDDNKDPASGDDKLEITDLSGTEQNPDNEDASVAGKTDTEKKSAEAAVAFTREVDVEGADYRLIVTCPADSGIPEDATFRAIVLPENHADYEAYRDKAFASVDEKANEENSRAEKMLGLFDLTIYNADGNAIEPKAPVSVTIDFGKTVRETDEDNIYAVHFPENGIQENETAEAASADNVTENKSGSNTGSKKNFAKSILKKLTESAIFSEQAIISNADVEVIKTEAQENGEISFEAGGFSVYAIVYTVDFHWEVDGKMYDFSIPGGGFVSFTDLVEVLGISKQDVKEDFSGEVDEKTSEKTSENGDDDAAKVQGIVGQDVTNDAQKFADGVSDDAHSAPLTLADVEISEDTRKFVADVESIAFSTPSLLSVNKVEESTTVGAIKDGLGLECEYSAELTEEQIAEINAQTVEAGDWALISVQPFSSEETLTVTMKNGDSFEIRVTDAQIKKTVISASGETYEITVTYSEDAQIPDGAELKVREILPEDEEYSQLQNDVQTNLTEGHENTSAHPAIFDIFIWADGQMVEPIQGSEVKVEVRLIHGARIGLYTSEDSPILINDHPLNITSLTEEDEKVRETTDNVSGDEALTDELAHVDPVVDMAQKITVIHQIEEGSFEIPETVDTISEEEVVSSFVTSSFSNYLVFLDQDVDTITVGPGDTITLRPYSQWVWNQQNQVNGQTVSWKNPQTNGRMTVKSDSYTDSQLSQTYNYYQLTAGTNPGEFDIETTAGNKIHVVVTGQPASAKPGTVAGLSDITVNLFDYDLDKSLDDKENVASWIDGKANTNGKYTKYDGGKYTEVSNAGSFGNDGINSGSALKFLGWGASNGKNSINNYVATNPSTNIVYNTLISGSDGQKYPRLNGNGNTSLEYLFSTKTASLHNDVEAHYNVPGLFRLENGYYYFNSNTNYAYYDNTSNSFKLYEHTYTQVTTRDGTQGLAENSKPIGFFPFHDYDSNNNLSPNQDKTLNHHFGLTLNQTFSIPAGGKDINGNPIIFEFSGDDDMWVYIGDDLALDLGGIHQPITGKIDFSTIDSGYATVYVGGKDVKHVSMTAFKEYTLRAFYLERGGCDSNCSIKFNLPTYKTLKLSKRLNGLSEKEYEKYKDEWFDYQLVVNGNIYHSPAGADENPDLRPILKDGQGRVLGSDYQLVTDENGNLLSQYQNKTEAEKEAILRWMVITEDKIQLKDGWTIEIPHLARTDTFYAAEEDNVNMDEFERPHAEREFHDTLNGEKHEEEVDLTDSQTVDNSHIHDWKTETYSLQETEKVTFTNTLKEKNIDVEKQWSDSAEAHTNDSITFRLVAKIPSSEGEGLYTSVHGGNIWGKVTGEVNNNEILDPHEEEVLLQQYTLSSKNNWKMSFEHLPAVTEKDEVITYSVEEVSTTEGYTTSDPTFVESYDVDVFKYFPDDSYPVERIGFYLLKDGKYYNQDGTWVDSSSGATEYYLTKSSVQDESYHCRFKDMPDGTYTVDEVEDSNLLTKGLVIHKRPLKKFTILNEKIPGGKITVQKVWKDADGKNITSDSAQHPTTITYDIYRVKHVHEWDLENPVTDQQPTDTATGLKHYNCKHKECSEKKEEMIPSLGCVMGEWCITKEAACDKEGEETRVCINNPEHVETRPINALGHTWGEWTVNLAATCEAPGMETRTCTRTGCGATEERTVSALGHDWDEGVVTKAPTTTEKGIRTFTCKHDTSHTKTEEIDMLPSTLTVQYHLREKNNISKGTAVSSYKSDGSLQVDAGGKIRVAYTIQSSNHEEYYQYGNGNKTKIPSKQRYENYNYYYDYEILIPVEKGKELSLYLEPGAHGSRKNFIIESIPSSEISVSASSPLKLAPRKAAPLPATTKTGYLPLNELIATVGYTDDEGDHLYYYAEQYKKGETLGPNNWTAQYDVELQDADGNAWTYYFVETAPSSGWITTYEGQDNGLKNGGKTTITNQKIPERGSLLITKKVTYNGGTVPEGKKEKVNKTFAFTIARSGEEVTQSPVLITVSDGAEAEELIENLEPGDYVITESDNGGLTLTNWEGGASQNSSAKSVTVTVTAGKTAKDDLLPNAKATFTNNYADTTVKLKKVDAKDVTTDSADTLKGAKFTVTKYTNSSFYAIDNTQTAYSQSKEDSKKKDGTYTLNGSFEFTDLPIGFYRASEDVMPAGYVKTGDDPAFEVRQKSGTSNELEVVLWKKTADGYVEVKDGSTEMLRIPNGTNTIVIGNEPGVALPSTGGLGTRLFTILGSVLVCFAGVMFIRRRRFI